MGNPRAGSPGSTRECPHCKATILSSASVCPACKHHLRFDPSAAATPSEAFTALQVDGTVRHPPDAEPWEYSVVVTIQNDRGEEIARKVIGVGAISADEQRSFRLSVQVEPVRGRGAPKGGTRH